MSEIKIKSRRDMLRRVVYPGWGLLGILVVLIEPLIKINPTLGATVGITVLVINIANAIRVVMFIRDGYREASHSDQLLQQLNLPLRTVPIVIVIGSIGLALYLSYALVTLATLAKYSIGGAIVRPLIVLAVIQYAILAPLYFWMDKKLTTASKKQMDSLKK